MATTEIQRLSAELAEVNRMLDSLSPKAITSRLSIQSKKRDIERRVALLSDRPETAAFVQLLFTGAPVADSKAIDAGFAAQALQNYQELIKKTKAVKQGTIGKRNAAATTAESESSFYLTGIARGSFGFTLEEKTDTGSLLFESSLKDIVKEVSESIQTFCESSDEEYSSFVQEMNPILFSAFKGFFKLLKDSEAQIKIADRIQQQGFDSNQIAIAAIRTESTQSEEEIREYVGILQGITPVGGSFDFLTQNQLQISGKISSSYKIDYRNQTEQGLFLRSGEVYRATIIKRTTVRGTSVPQVSYYLLNLVEG